MSAPPPPPYAGVPGAAPPPPRKPRPSAWWFALGGFLVVAAVGAGIGLFAWTLSAFLATDAEVPVDGRPHQVTVPVDGDRMLWVDESAVAPDCTVVDLADGREIPLEDVAGDFRRDTAGVADWVGAHRFAPGSGQLEVTCTGARSTPLPTVEIGPAPAVASFALGIVASILVPLALGGTGFVVLVVTGIRYATRPPRPRD